MTRTEERLRNYFAAVETSIQPGNTAPLTTPRPHRRSRRANTEPRHRGWRAWGVPLTAAASVLAIASLAVAAAGLTAGHRPGTSPESGASAGRPQYYAEVDGSETGGSVVIRSSSSGAVIASVAKSALLRESGLPAQPDGVLTAAAAAPDDRTFYAAMLTRNQAWIFTFRVNGAGPVTGIARIEGGVVQGGYSAGLFSLTVSPDGERLALTTTSSDATVEGGGVNSVQDEIVVIDLRTGTQRSWHGGLYRAGRSSEFDIQSLSWSDNGQSLVFVPVWCSPVIGYESSCPYVAGHNASTQVRLLHVDGRGTSLAGSQVLLPASDSVQQVVSDQDGHLDVLRLSGPTNNRHLPMTVTVEQFSAASGAPRRVLYRHDYQGSSFGDHLIRFYLAGDPSGRYLLIGLESDVSTIPNEVGWIDHNSLHAMTVGKEDAELLPDSW